MTGFSPIKIVNNGQADMKQISRFSPYICIVAVAAMFPLDAGYALYVWGGGLALVSLASLLQLYASQQSRAETDELRRVIGSVLERRDLTLRCAEEGESVGRLFNGLTAQLCDALRRDYQLVQEAAKHLKQYAELAEKPGRGQSTQAARISGMVGNIEKISASVNEIAASVSQAEQVAGNVESNGLQGMGVIGEAVKVAETIENSIEGVTQSIAKLGDRADEINSMVGSVRAIAEQTNLLALNAAIEAARAGEQGRGFAVVADEVRKLAERTASTTREIATTVESIQKGIYSAVFEMRRANEDAGSGNKYAHQAEDAFRHINESVQQLVSMIRAIAAASRDQSISVEGMAGSVVQMASTETEGDSSRKSVQELQFCRNKLSEYELRFKV